MSSGIKLSPVFLSQHPGSFMEVLAMESLTQTLLEDEEYLQ